MIPLKYDEAGHFSDGLAVVKRYSQKAYIDTEGNEYWSMVDYEARKQMKNR